MTAQTQKSLINQAILKAAQTFDVTIPDACENDHIPPIRIGTVLDTLSRQHTARDELIEFDGHTLNTAHQIFTFANKGKPPLRLTQIETDILYALYHALPRHISRAGLLKEVWGYKTDIETHTLETHIYRLRRKIETDPSTPNIIITSDEGYRLGHSNG